MCKMMQITAIVMSSFFQCLAHSLSLAFEIVPYCCLSHVLTVTVCVYYAQLSPQPTLKIAL